jgi:hypothetical protein
MMCGPLSNEIEVEGLIVWILRVNVDNEGSDSDWEEVFSDNNSQLQDNFQPLQHLWLLFIFRHDMSQYSSMVIVLGYGLDDQRFKSQQGLGIFLFTTASRLALGPT